MLRSIGQSPTNLVQTVESPGADEEDVGGVDLDGLAAGLARAVLLGHVDHGPLHHLEHALLHALPAHIPQLVDPGHRADLVHLATQHVNTFDLHLLACCFKRCHQNFAVN